jgi:hypothetical protein
MEGLSPISWTQYATVVPRSQVYIRSSPVCRGVSVGGDGLISAVACLGSFPIRFANLDSARS